MKVRGVNSAVSSAESRKSAVIVWLTEIVNWTTHSHSGSLWGIRTGNQSKKKQTTPMNGIAIINNSDNQYTWLFIRSNMTPLVGDFNFTTLLLYSVVITGPLLLSLLSVPHSCLNKTPRCDNFHKQMHLSVSLLASSASIGFWLFSTRF